MNRVGISSILVLFNWQKKQGEKEYLKNVFILPDKGKTNEREKKLKSLDFPNNVTLTDIRGT